MNTHIKCFFIIILGSLLLTKVASAANTVPPILVGGTVSLEGAYKEPSLMAQKALKLWLKKVNATGGLLGRKVKLVLYDDKSDKVLTHKLYKKLIEEDNVDLVISPTSTPLTISASAVSEEHNMLMLAFATSSGQPWQRSARYLFQLYAPANRQFIGLFDIMARKKVKTLSIIYNDQSGFNRDMVSGIQEWAKIFKIDIIFQKAYQNGKNDLPDLVTKIKSVNAQGLINSSYPPDSYELLRLLQESRYRPEVLALPIVTVHPDFEKNAGDIANLIFGPSQWEPQKHIPFPGTAQFIQDFSNFAGHMPSYHAASAYAACQLYEQAIRKTQSIDSTKLRDYIISLDTVTVLGRFKVDSAGMQVGHNSFIIQWQNGKKEIVWPQKMQTAQPVF